MQVLKHILKI